MTLGLNVPTQLVTCKAGDYLLGIDVLQVQEVLKCQRMTRVPRTPSEIRGLINLRGHIVTAIGMRERLGLQVADEQEAQMNLIVTLSDCAASLIVDSVGDVIDVDAHSYKPRPSTLADPLSGMVLGVYQTLNGNGLLLHIDPEAVCHFLSSNQEVSHEQ